MTFINPADVARFKARSPVPVHTRLKATVPPADASESDKRQYFWASVGNEELGKRLRNAIRRLRAFRDESRLGDLDGQSFLADSLGTVMLLVQFDSEAQARATYDEQSAYLQNCLAKNIDFNVEASLVRNDRPKVVEAQIERDMAASATDAALAEAAEARAQLSSLQAQLKAEQRAHSKSRYDLGKQLERAQQPSSEVLALRERVTLLERQNKQFSQPSMKVSQPTQPEVLPMPKPTLALTFPTCLEALAFAAFARKHKAPDACVDGAATVTASVDLYRIQQAYQERVTDPRAYLRSLESVRACMGRQAA